MRKCRTKAEVEFLQQLKIYSGGQERAREKFPNLQIPIWPHKIGWHVRLLLELFKSTFFCVEENERHTAEVIDPTRLRFLFEKELQRSDVGPLRRIVLPKRAAEEYLPVLESKEGMFITMDDMDGNHVWRLKFRFWPNNNSRMYLFENTGVFVKTHGLRHGDYIVLYQNLVDRNYVIQARKAYDSVVHDTSGHGAQGILSDYAASDVVRGPESEINASGYIPEMFPPVNEMGDMSFIYDTSFSNDSPLDYLGGPMTDFSRVGGHESNFGSIDNLSLDDFF
ncbi:unnamed protein product [Coffea canephora]|uniref:TF-B3 domain-containing protein n=1 Tax=Coffea canephora TaxID=49390 RepID=A0A068V7Y1_COFCA|nr:unnamed protein product [Coffea canephora]